MQSTCAVTAVWCNAGAKANPNGAQSFWATAPQGSWQINLPYAGHMSFLDYDPATDPGKRWLPQHCMYRWRYLDNTAPEV